MEEKAIAKSDEIYLDLIGQMEEEKEDEERKKQHKEVFADLLARLSGVAAKSPNEEDIRARNVSEIEQIDYSLTNTVCYFLKGSSNHIDMIIGIDDYSKLIKKFPKSEFDIRISYKDDDLHIKPFWVEIVNKTTHTRLDVIVVYKSDKTFLKLSNQYMGKGTFDGNKIKLIPVDSLKNHDEGLAEAVDASTSWFYFSDKPFRLCNLKDYRCEYRRNLHYWDCWEKENFEKAYFQKRIFKKGQLKLLDITEEAYEKLNDFAKKYFIQGFDRYDKRGNPVYIYHPDIPKTYVREYEEKLFWNRLYIPDGEALSEEKKLDNWLNYKRECELWHYEGWKTSRYSKWERKVFHKQNRVRLKIEMDEVIQEYFECE